jgi:hypothetical protein
MPWAFSSRTLDASIDGGRPCTGPPPRLGDAFQLPLAAQVGLELGAHTEHEQDRGREGAESGGDVQHLGPRVLAGHAIDDRQNFRADHRTAECRQ